MTFTYFFVLFISNFIYFVFYPKYHIKIIQNNLVPLFLHSRNKLFFIKLVNIIEEN